MAGVMTVSFHGQSDSAMVVVTPRLGGNSVNDIADGPAACAAVSPGVYEACHTMESASISCICDAESKTEREVRRE
jgi:hypothetical protein